MEEIWSDVIKTIKNRNFVPFRTTTTSLWPLVPLSPRKTGNYLLGEKLLCVAFTDSMNDSQLTGPDRNCIKILKRLTIVCITQGTWTFKEKSQKRHFGQPQS